MGRNKKTSDDVRADYSGKGRNGRIYRDWQAFCSQARLRLKTDKSARGAANRLIAKKYDLKSTDQVRNIIRAGDAFWAAAHVEASRESKIRNRQALAFRQLYDSVEKAASLLPKPFYKDLLDGCAMLPRVKRPRAMLAFTSDEAATAQDSLQVLAAVLAKGFLRAHEILGKDNPGYAERAPRTK